MGKKLPQACAAGSRGKEVGGGLCYQRARGGRGNRSGKEEEDTGTLGHWDAGREELQNRSGNEEDTGTPGHWEGGGAE